MNFNEFVDALPPHMRQAAWDHMVLKLTGKPAPPLVMPISTTLSSDLPIDDQIVHLSKVLKIDPSLIDKDHFVTLAKKVEIRIVEIKKMIGHLLGHVENRKQWQEIISIGSFLFTTKIEALVEKSERPDFILKISGAEVGVEHTRLGDFGSRKLYSELLKKYIEDASKILLGKNRELTGIVDLVLDFNKGAAGDFTLIDLMQQSKLEMRIQIQNEIAEYIYQLSFGSNQNCPKFIKKCIINPSNTPIEIRLREEYFERMDFQEKLTIQINAKNEKLNSYKKNRDDVFEWWLLITFDGLQHSSSFRIQPNLIEDNIPTSYDRIFIMNSFSLQCFELKKDSPFLVEVGLESETFYLKTKLFNK